MNYLKQPRFESERWRCAVASLPCVRCGMENDTQAAHRNQGKGLSFKTDDCLTAALCTTCHVTLDSGKQWTRDERREQMDDAILKTIVQLARLGLVRPV